MKAKAQPQHARPRPVAEHTRGAVRHSSVRAHHALGRFCRARATETLFTWFGLHVTKVHVYGVTSGGLSLSYWGHGEPVFGTLVLIMAALDMASDVRRP